MGSRDAKAFLASPEVVAASALKGSIAAPDYHRAFYSTKARGMIWCIRETKIFLSLLQRLVIASKSMPLLRAPRISNKISFKGSLRISLARFCSVIKII